MHAHHRLYSEGHYEVASKFFKYGARYADKLSQLSIGLMYENGRVVKKDPVTACAWPAHVNISVSSQCATPCGVAW